MIRTLPILERFSARPNFPQALVYPGPLGMPEKVPADAPPAFLLVANDDRGAARAITGLLQKYREAGAPVEAHIYSRGGHAFNMGFRTPLVSLKAWPERMHQWMADNYILDPSQRAVDERRAKEADERRRQQRTDRPPKSTVRRMNVAALSLPRKDCLGSPMLSSRPATDSKRALQKLAGMCKKTV